MPEDDPDARLAARDGAEHAFEGHFRAHAGKGDGIEPDYDPLADD